MRFGTSNVWSLHRAGSLTAAARELARYLLGFTSTISEFVRDISDVSV
jgi:hypothetical protein